MGPAICPVCNGKTMMTSSFYGGAIGGALTTCKSCAGTGVIWPPGTDAFLAALTQAAERTSDPLAMFACVDVDLDRTPNNQEWALLEPYLKGAQAGEYDIAIGTDWIVDPEPLPPHPERKAVLDYLATLPEDMPIMVLTPQSEAERIAAKTFGDKCKELGSLGYGGDTGLRTSVWIAASAAKYTRMRDWSTARSWMRALPPDVSPRLAGLPVSENDE